MLQTCRDRALYFTASPQLASTSGKEMIDLDCNCTRLSMVEAFLETYFVIFESPHNLPPDMSDTVRICHGFPDPKASEGGPNQILPLGMVGIKS